MAVAAAETAAIPMIALKRFVTATLLVVGMRPAVAQPSVMLAVSTSVGTPATPIDSAYRRIVYRAHDALATRRWRTAAELWESALLSNADTAAHWHSYAHSLYESGRNREAIGAYQRGLQIGGGEVDDALWNIARAYAKLGNRKQAMRWLSQALQRGLHTRADAREEAVFRRYARDAEFLALLGEGRATRVA